MKLGIVCFANNSGLGNQTRRLTYMLRPYRILVIDSKSFSKNTKQNFEWYEDFGGYKVDGFPRNHEVKKFLEGLTHVIVCENPLNNSFFAIARNMGVKTYCQSNYEFCDHLNQPHLPFPDMFLMPSYWMVETMRRRFKTPVVHLPPPIDPAEFKEPRDRNFKRTEGPYKFLHIVGTLAASDRNGTLDLLAALSHTSADFSLTIKSQHELPENYIVSDRRVRYCIENEPDTAKLYDDYDCLVLPRRYGGLALTCNEAMMSGMPVIMPDISPNNELLPREWVVKASVSSRLQTRDLIDVHSTDPQALAEKMEWIIEQDQSKLKIQAFDLAYESFSPTKLLPKYEALWSLQ